MKSQFYITLPSNSSMQYFPDNKTCCYITQLPRTIELSGEWEVAIVEIQYPLTYLPDKNTKEVQKIPSLMFVYCDIIEPRIVGDIYAPLLRILQVRQSADIADTEVKTFSPPHYLPLLLLSFRTIEISIRDQQGKSIPFDHGTLTVTLHFKKVY